SGSPQQLHFPQLRHPAQPPRLFPTSLRVNPSTKQHRRLASRAPATPPLPPESPRTPRALPHGAPALPKPVPARAPPPQHQFYFSQHARQHADEFPRLPDQARASRPPQRSAVSPALRLTHPSLRLTPSDWNCSNR